MAAGRREGRVRVVTFAVSLLLSLSCAEVLLRLLTAFPIHGRLANREPDPILGYRMSRTLPGVDASGFRNAVRPAQPDIVVLGDSHTYGYNVAPADNWPSQVAAATGRSVYNMGVGGYGAYQYRALLDEAVKLRPRVVVAAVYPLNDAADLCGSQRHVVDRAAWQRITGLSWAECETGVKGDVQGDQPVSEWASAHSAAVSLVRWAYGHNRMRRILDGSQQESDDDVIVRDAIGGRYYFRASTTRARADAVDGADRRIRLGLDQLALFAAEADRRMRDTGGRFVVLFVPIRERSFADELRKEGRPPDLERLLTNEAAVQAELERRLRLGGIAYASAWSYLASARSSGERIYPDGDDDHPARAGYRAYATTVTELLSR
jgi:hypothetical protein